MSEKEYYKAFDGKVTERQLDDFANELTKALPDIVRLKKKVRINLADVEWIANQELLFITGLLRYFVESQIPFFVHFVHAGQLDKISYKKAIQIVQIWDVWKIGQVIPNHDYNDYFDISASYTEKLKRRFPISNTKQEIYNRHGVTPFVILEKIEQPDDQKINAKLSRVYQLGKATRELLAYHQCSMPFDNQTLSSIVTKELYENFLDHFSKGIFNTKNNYSFLSVSLIAKIVESDRTRKDLQYILARNFMEEQFPQAKNFFYDARRGAYRNRSVLQLSFLDFGGGITQTLLPQYRLYKSTQLSPQALGGQVLRYAFRHDSSKDPIDVKYLDKSLVPRGLFDLLVIVKRFNGMLVARSGYGRVLFDFSIEDPITNKGLFFGDPTQFFPGTLISIYIPERKGSEPISLKTISPYESIDKVNFFRKKVKHISLFDIQSEIKRRQLTKNVFYIEVFRKVLKMLDTPEKDILYYVDFAGYEIDSRVTKKLIYFLVTDYRINFSNSVIVVNPPSIEVLEAIHFEMAQLSDIVKRFNVHPVPFIFISNGDMRIFWMGIFHKEDIEQLNRLLLEVNDLRVTDFREPESISGNVNYYDEYGNLHSLIDKGNGLQNILENREGLQEHLIKELIMPCLKEEPGFIYLCSGNYYQYKYFQLFNIVSDKNACRILSEILAERLVAKVGVLSKYYYLYSSSAGKAIVDAWVTLQVIHQDQVVDVGSDFSQVVVEIQKKASKGAEFIIVCDMLSTGYMPYKLGGILTKLSMVVRQVAVFVNSIDKRFIQDGNRFLEFYDKMVVSLTEESIPRYRREDIVEKLKTEELHVRRIDPYVNSPITKKYLNHTGQDLALISNEEFISFIDEKHVKAGYYQFNNLIHPYFFDMDELLKDKIRSHNILELLFSRMPSEHSKGIGVIFYPKDSGIENVDFDFLRERILLNHAVEVVELQRFSTSEGWKFSHLPDYLYDIPFIEKALILDDGSCSGESIIQMVDEITSLNVKELIILSVIGRVNGHKREFFSRLKAVNGKFGTIPISVYFGSHWHVPTYYLQENPVLAEKKWLDEVDLITNLPPNIRGMVKFIRQELELKGIDEPNNKFLITDGKNNPVVRDYLLAKEEIGKVTSYRLYQDYFNYFNELVLDYDKDKMRLQHYRKIEIIAAVILHEPNLYDSIKEVLPDLIEKLELFVLSIFIGTPNKKGNPILFKKGLHYKWTNKNLLHLLFVTFRDGAFFNTFKQNHIILILHRFCQKSETDLDYFLYRTLKYIPHKTPTSDSHIYAGRMKVLIDTVLESRTLNGGFVKPLKRFRSFLATLPDVSERFETALSKVKNNYSKLIDDENHANTSINVKYDVLLTQLELLESKFSDKVVATINQEWDSFSEFFENLLSFSNSFPKYFGPCADKVYGKLELYDDSLRVLHGVLLNHLYEINPLSDFQEISFLLQKIMDGFVASSSVYYQIFNSITTPDIYDEFERFLERLKDRHKKCFYKVTGYRFANIAVGVPQLYVKDILFEEIKENFRHCDFDEQVSFRWERNQDVLTLQITNTVAKARSQTGGGAGMSILEAFNEVPGKQMTYHFEDKKDLRQYLQKITFKIL